MPVRPSALSLAEKCPLSPVLSARYQELNPNIERGQFVEQRVYEALETGQTPEDADAADCYRWLRAHVDITEYQREVTLYEEKRAPPWPVNSDFITKGTPDIVAEDQWTRDLCIIDLKKREQVTWGKVPDADNNLQLHAYAIAHALRDEYPRYRTCLLTFGEGRAEALWSRTYTSVEWRPILERIKQICLRPGNTSGEDPPGRAGPHCTDCYARLHCPNWALPAHQGPSALEVFTREGGLTRDNVERAYLAAKSVKEMGERALELIQAYRLIRGPGSVMVGEKSWEPVQTAGRKTADVAALERDGLSGYVRQGQPFQQWRLVKAPK